jgi:hypothetical protein
MEFYKLSTNRTLSVNNVTVNGDSLTINITDSTNKDTLGNQSWSGEFSLVNLITNYSQDHGCIAIYPQTVIDGSPLLAMETTQISYNERASSTAATQSPTVPGKYLAGSPFSVVSSKVGSYAYVYILTPYVNCNISDLILVYRDSSAVVINNSATVTDATPITSMKHFLDSWLPITVTGPLSIATGTTQTYTVSAPANTTVYLSTDIGIINRSRIVSGGSFNLDTSGLAAGEIVDIKAGYKFWSGISNTKVTLT